MLWLVVLVRGEQLLDDPLNNRPGGGKRRGEYTCHKAENNHENNACREGGHIVERKIIVIVTGVWGPLGELHRSEQPQVHSLLLEDIAAMEGLVEGMGV